VLPPEKLPLLHPFPDAEACKCLVPAYALDEILAEKLRSWIQRTRSRDLFDAVRIIRDRRHELSLRQILRVFEQKTVFKHVSAGRDELLVDDKFTTVTSHWTKAII